MDSGGTPRLTNGRVVFDRYRLKALVGRGAMGVVWRAFDEELEIDIALKLLGEEFLFDPAALADLKRETRRGMALAHPHIVRIYGFFQGGGHAAIAMELVEGNTLAALQAARRPRCFEVDEITDWTRQLCSALHYAHTEAQVVHRDLKPGNLMVDDRGRLKVADFGIAAGLSAQSRLNQAEDTRGTPSYMSPQQLLGQNPCVEHDIYSLGATLYDLLTGRPPFHSGDISLQIRTVPPPAIAARRAENGFAGAPVPPEWEQTIAACLAKDASLRPVGAAQVAERLGLGAVGITGTAGGTRSPLSGSAAPLPSSGSAPTVLQPSNGAASAPPTSPGARSTADRVQPTVITAPAPRRSSRIVVAAALAMVAVALAVAYFALRSGAPAPTAPGPVAAAPAPSAAANSVAVLAFANMMADRDTEYFSDGVSEEILNALANNPALRVAARTSSFSFKGKNVTAQEIGRTLHVANVIEGSVRRAGNTVRITVQLINATDGYHAWSETFTRDMTDIFAVQDEIAAKVAQKVSGGPAAAVATSGVAPTKNLAAYDAYLRGRAAQRSGFSVELSADAVRYFEEAVRLDPDYALAWARLAETFVREWNDAFDRSGTVATKAREAAAAALRLAPNLPEAHLAQALVAEALDTDLKTASAELDRVEQLRPNDPEVPAARARIERTRGHRGEPVVALAARAVDADPQNSDTLVLMAIYLTACGRFAEAERDSERAWAISQVSEQPILANVANLLAWTGDARAALAQLETVPAPLREPRFYLHRADLLAYLGRFVGAAADYERTRTMILASEQHRTRSGPRSTALLAHGGLAWLETKQGHADRAAARYAEDLAEVDGYIRDYPDSTFGFATRAWIQAAQGRRAEALAAMAEAMRLARLHPDAVATIEAVRFSDAGVLGALGDADAAVAGLRALHDAGVVFGYTLRSSQFLEPLRTKAKFQQLMKEAEARADAVPRLKK
jgi:serine/threonine protein kinase/TolB-like protein